MPLKELSLLMCAGKETLVFDASTRAIPHLSNDPLTFQNCEAFFVEASQESGKDLTRIRVSIQIPRTCVCVAKFVQRFDSSLQKGCLEAIVPRLDGFQICFCLPLPCLYLPASNSIPLFCVLFESKGWL